MKNPVLVGFVVASALLPIFSPNFRADEQQNTEAEVKTYSFVATVKEKHTPQLLVGFPIIDEELDSQSTRLFSRFRIAFDKGGETKTDYWMDKAHHGMELPEVTLLFEDIPEKGGKVVVTLDRNSYPERPNKITLLV